MATRKAAHESPDPSWTEVILAAALSVILGAAVGVVVLALKPLTAVRELPKEPAAGTIYYVLGSRDTARAKQAAAKRKTFAQGGSVSLTEDEVNSLLAAPLPAPAAKAGTPAATPANTGGAGLSAGEPNVRFHDGAVQIVVPVTLNLLGLQQEMTVLAKGTFVKKSGGFRFEPQTLYLGSCAVQRLPLLREFVAGRMLASHAVPDDVAAVWPRVASVAVEGSVLKLTMP